MNDPLELSHILTEKLKPIPMHHVRITFFYHYSGQVHTYIYLYLKTRHLVLWGKFYGEYALTEVQVWNYLLGIRRFVVALLEHCNSSNQANIILFSIRNIILNLSNLAPIQRKIRAEKYEKNVCSFLFELSS